MWLRAWLRRRFGWMAFYGLWQRDRLLSNRSRLAEVLVYVLGHAILPCAVL